MSLDLVHDIQAVYRKTVDAISRPGLICNIKNQADKVDMEIGCFKSTVLLALMLFDTEVTFKVISEHETEIARLINQLTYAQTTVAEKADFILVLRDAKPEDFERAIHAAYPGNLMDPHQSATFIFEAESLSQEKAMILTGPGIKSENTVKVETNHDWVELRAQKNGEYPLGVDFIFTDPLGNLMSLPRTTRIIKQEII